MTNLNPPPLSGAISDNVGRPLGGWPQWFQQMFYIVFDVQNSGTTAQRPVDRIYPGKPYFDLTLGIPIWVKLVGPPIVWINAAGAPV